MKEQLEKIKEEAVRQIEASDALDRLNEIRVAYLGKKGELTGVLKGMKNVAPEDRPKVGQMVNEVREMIEAKLEETKQAFDFIFMDPPYNCGWEASVLAYLTHSCLADKDTTVIIEASKETSEVFIKELGWELLRVKDYKTNKHIFTAKGDC